ncbi:THUMP domain-containing protein 1 isoform X1 [Periplaneta americana]|uniref:THUMP domain-containing protein 1 isoform X1 n=1 Tax=Periplaneta americana TaxID=6978 RepID=UPI0037E9C796
MSSYQKRKKSNFYNAQKMKKKREFVLKPGLKGFLCTCNNREKDCVRESYNILNEYADNLYGEEKASADASVCSVPEKNDADSEEDIETALNKELKLLKAERKKLPNMRRFQVVESGANNCLFIQTTAKEPVQLVHHIMKDLEATRKQKTRFLLRLLPIEATCKAYLEDIRQTAEPLFDKYFTKEGKTFVVLFNRRNSSGINREDLIRDLAEMVLLRHPDNKADLKHPQLAVIVEVIRNMCCLSVLPDYFQLRKYNLLELCTPEGGIKLINEKNDKLASENREDNSETVTGQNGGAGGDAAVQEEITEQKNSEADANMEEGNGGKGNIGEISDSEMKSETED